jgi:hypothetical protein
VLNPSAAAGVGCRLEVSMRENADRYLGSRVRELPRRNRTYPPGRVCAHEGCDTVLSIYSRWNYCWQHEPVHSYVPRGRRAKRGAKPVAA